MLVPLVLLSGCISLLPKAPPPPRVFALDAGDVNPGAQAPLDLVIAVSAPQGERSILGSEIIWRTGAEVASVAGTRWAGRAAELLQSTLVETLSRQNAARAVVRPGEVQADYQIRWTVRSFEVVDQDAGGVARFSANVLIIKTQDASVVGVREITAEAPVASRSQAQAATSLTRAAREGSARIGQFILETLSASQASTASSRR
jgi:ABC-type uncharacterized transport system auxiliary subunit